MVKEALEKVQSETNAAPDDTYVAAVGAFLMDYVRKHPEHAPLIMANGKTIAGSLAAMREVAKKKQKNGVGVLAGAEPFTIVLKYYGIAASEPAVPAPAPTPAGLKLELEDLF